LTVRHGVALAEQSPASVPVVATYRPFGSSGGNVVVVVDVVVVVASVVVVVASVVVVVASVVVVVSTGGVPVSGGQAVVTTATADKTASSRPVGRAVLRIRSLQGHIASRDHLPSGRRPMIMRPEWFKRQRS